MSSNTVTTKKKKNKPHNKRKAIRAGKFAVIPSSDPRRAPAAPNVTTLPSTNSTIVVDRPWSGESAVAVSWGYVCAAVARGMMTVAPNPYVPAYAAEYMISVLTSYALGTTILAATLPLWMLSLCRAISPKTVHSTVGGVAYKWTGQAISFPVAGLAISPDGAFLSRLVIPSNGPTVWGFPTGALPLGYTTAEGERAFLSVAQFMGEGDFAYLNKLYPVASLTAWDTNVSSWAVQTTITGWGPGGSGGCDLIADLEVPIRTPLLTLWNNPSPQPAATLFGRGGQWSTHTSGTPLFLGAALPSILPGTDWDTKKKPYFKFYDFLEFGQVLAFYVQELQAQWAAAQNSQMVILDPLEYQCPLSLQEMLLCLRQEIMYRMSNTQSGVQGLTPRLTSTNYMFIPFAAGTNTAATTSINMLLPLALVENIKSACLVSYVQPKKKKINRGGCRYWIPVLGKYENFALSQGDYSTTWIVNGSDVEQNCFFNATLKCKDAKGIMKDTAEPVINLIDGTSSGTPVFINDTERLGTLVTFWNQYVKKMSMVSSTLTTISSDDGVKVVGVPFLTRHWAPTSVNSRARAITYEDSRVVKNPSIFKSVYADLQAFSVSSSIDLVSGTDVFFRSFVLPINYIGPADNVNSELDYTRYQGLYGENKSIITSSTGDSAKTLAEVHRTFAIQLVRGQGEPVTEFDSFLQLLDAKGQAGILSSLASQIGGALFGPGAGQVIGSIGNALGL